MFDLVKKFVPTDPGGHLAGLRTYILGASEDARRAVDLVVGPVLAMARGRERPKVIHRDGMKTTLTESAV